MKFENKFKVFLAVFVTLNLLFLKLSNNAKNEALKFIESNPNKEEIKKSILNFREVSNNLINTDENQMVNEAKTNKQKNSTISTSPQTSHSNSTSVVGDVGENINNGPIPIPTNKNLLEMISIEKEDYKGSEESQEHIVTANTPQAIDNTSHLFSFLLILSIVILITLLIIMYNLEKEKRIESESEKYFRRDLISDEDYYLIKD